MLTWRIKELHGGAYREKPNGLGRRSCERPGAAEEKYPQTNLPALVRSLCPNPFAGAPHTLFAHEENSVLTLSRNISQEPPPFSIGIQGPQNYPILFNKLKYWAPYVLPVGISSMPKLGTSDRYPEDGNNRVPPNRGNTTILHTRNFVALARFPLHRL